MIKRRSNKQSDINAISQLRRTHMLSDRGFCGFNPILAKCTQAQVRKGRWKRDGTAQKGIHRVT